MLMEAAMNKNGIAKVVFGDIKNNKCNYLVMVSVKKSKKNIALGDKIFKTIVTNDDASIKALVEMCADDVIVSLTGKYANELFDSWDADEFDCTNCELKSSCEIDGGLGCKVFLDAHIRDGEPSVNEYEAGIKKLFEPYIKKIINYMASYVIMLSDRKYNKNIHNMSCSDAYNSIVNQTKEVVCGVIIDLLNSNGIC